MKISGSASCLMLAVLTLACSTSNHSIQDNAKKHSGQPQIDDLFMWVESKIDSTMRVNTIPALSIGIIREGKLLYTKGFGNYERGTNRSVDAFSLYQIGSDTKKFTGIIARNLMLEEKLRLMEPITTYLPDSLRADARKKLQKILVKDLLLHLSGIPTRAPRNIRTDGDPMLIEYQKKDLLDDLNDIKLDTEPGKTFGYSNFGYAVLGFICEVVSGLSYADLVKKYITEKWGMRYTGVFPIESQLPFIVTPYRKDDRNKKSSPWTMGKMTPAGGIYSNVFDIAKLMIAQINAYKEFSKTGKTKNPLILTEIEGTEGRSYGFGLAKVTDSIGVRYGHGGDLDGYGSTYLFFPDLNSGLILLTSSGGRWLGRLEQEISSRLRREKR